MAAPPPSFWASPIPTITASPGLELGLEKQIHAHAGGQVATSIDMRVQYILAHETEAARETFSAKAAGGIVMDVKTGEILAMISLPDFDPNAAPAGRRRLHPQHHGAGRLRAGLGVQDLLLRAGVRRPHHPAWTKSSPSARASRSANSPSMKPSTCRPPWRRAISWRSPPISAPRRSRCAPAACARQRIPRQSGPAQAGA